MPSQPSSPTWDEDPTGASIVLATGRRRHDLLVIAEPALLTELDEAWGRPTSRVPLSLLPGVSAPGARGYEDMLYSFDRGDLGVLVARGRTVAFEGKPARRTTSLARIAAGAGVRAAVLVARATSLGAAQPGDFLAVADHMALGSGPLFASGALVEAAWDTHLTDLACQVEGVRGAAVAALQAGPVRTTPAEAGFLAAAGADIAVTDTVAEAMALAARGVAVTGLAYVDRQVAGLVPSRRSGGRRAAEPTPSPATRRPATHVVRGVVEAVEESLR